METQQHLEERKLVTVLFSDLVDSTALGEALDPEVLSLLLGDYFEAMAGALERWGGRIEKYIGDAVVAVFGVPTAREDDATRAICAGLEMHQRLREINPRLEDLFGVTLDMRIGVNTGEVLASSDADAVIAGDVFNMASRIEGIAKPGSVVASERTFRAAESAVEFAPIGEHGLKGKQGTHPLWRAVKPRLAPTRDLSETPLVGRTAELGMLQALLERVVGAQSPQLVLVAGEAGIGKSRLVREFLEAAGEPVRSLIGRCLPYGQGITYWPLREVLWAACGIVMDDTSGRAAEKLRTLVEGLPEDSVPDSRWLAFALATTAGISLADNPFEQLAPESAGGELRLAWPAFASALASEQPTALVIEDIHWAEQPLLDMVELLALRSLGPLLIVATARPDFMTSHAGWGATAIPSQISLGPLSASSFEELMATLLPGLGEDIRRDLLVGARGNPFFAEEMARHALASGVDRALSSLPDSARSVLAARIDELAQEDREVLQNAAVVGEVFWPAPLQRVGGHGVEESLVSLEARGFITARPVTSLRGQREYSFRHGLMSDVAYQSIPLKRLAPAHAAVAEWTQEATRDRQDEFIEVVAHHYSAAADPERSRLAWSSDPERAEEVRRSAVEALIAAGRAARRNFAIEQAAGYADRALTLATTEDEQLASLELKASSYHAAARVDEAFPVYLDAIDLARSIGNQDDISRVITGATLMWTRYSGAFKTEDWKTHAVRIVNDRLAEIGEQTDSLEAAALLAGRSVWGRREMIGRTATEGKADSLRAIEVSERLGSEELLAHSLDAYEMVLREEGLCELGEVTDRMVELGSKMTDRRQAHEMLITSAVALTELGRFEDSRLVGAKAHADAQKMGLHQKIHGVRSLTAHMIPEGAFEQLALATDNLFEMITADGGSVCDYGGGAVAGRVIALFELRRTEEALEALDFFWSGLPRIRRSPVVEYQLMERVRPFVTPDRVEALLNGIRDPRAPMHAAAATRVRLPLAVTSGAWDTIEGLAVTSRQLAEKCCAPQLTALADWAEATRAGSIEAAGTALEGFYEPYTAARLAVDFLATDPPGDTQPMRSATERTLESMGASASLEQLRQI